MKKNDFRMFYALYCIFKKIFFGLYFILKLEVLSEKVSISFSVEGGTLMVDTDYLRRDEWER